MTESEIEYIHDVYENPPTPSADISLAIMVKVLIDIMESLRKANDLAEERMEIDAIKENGDA